MWLYLVGSVVIVHSQLLNELLNFSNGDSPSVNGSEPVNGFVS